MKNHLISGKTIWITGASSGIGYELASELAKARNFVYLSARSKEKLQALKLRYPDNVYVLPLDVVDPASLVKAEKDLQEHTDHLDLVVLCAGTCDYDDSLSLLDAHYERLTQTNYLGSVRCLRIALPLLRRANGRAQIVGVSSLASVLPFPARAAAYGASKAALEYFLQSLAVDLQYDSIDVSVVRPGFVDTPLTRKNDFDMPFLMTTAQAAGCILKGVAERKRVIEFPKRLVWSLKIMGLIPIFWMKVFAPKFRKSSTL